MRINKNPNRNLLLNQYLDNKLMFFLKINQNYNVNIKIFN